MKETLFTIILISLIMSACTDKELRFTPSYGARVTDNGVSFRLHAPRAENVYLVIFSQPEDETGDEILMNRKTGDDWELTVASAGSGTLYGYRLEGPEDIFDRNIIIADPYSRAAVTQNSYRHVAKSMVVESSFDWGGDTWLSRDPRDLIICELHVRDMTMGNGSGTVNKGTYKGLIEEDQTGGIQHIRDMGFNAVQILPAQDYANVEVPYLDREASVYNTWNPYARNHWGYMTTFFFAPETYYSESGTMEPGAWNGIDGQANNEFKEMVKGFHKEGISVIMDVVYNHVSNYDYHPLKFIDRDLYFRLNDDGSYIAQSGCGNDTRSESPAMRQLILESLKYWMIEYHVDGFRFDLGYLIDEETRDIILQELRSINPGVIILAEPWGGGYDPDGFSDRGWASFNDRIRNGVKGQDPHDGHGFIFGKWQGSNDPEALQNFAMGSLRTFGGQYVDAAHSVNYLESHDDHTFGDFVRLGLGLARENEKIEDSIKNATVAGRALALNKLGAMFLMTSQGITFMHQGQSWGRSKVIAETDVPDERIGHIDHNSYEKDNETNWINWEEKKLNHELVDYYRGLIALRKNNKEFRRSEPGDFTFSDTGAKTALAYSLQDRFFVALNGDMKTKLNLDLPAGEWIIVADGKQVNENGLGRVSGKIQVPASSGMILKKAS